ncbi:uncharacterized protein LOC124690006 [Lolium rigidum]|uniref:uncharacterized protein LOC124690006 n=1 Tax=Lolium rigidum TaxID=89674 RepID=UPI001F5CD023|nr:uncharacterized protein LOC124690006 [Lolium rigidum]
MYDFSPTYLSPLLKENVRPGRKRILDDALFEFFRKEAVKSLKRDFAKFCNESVIFSKRKRLKEHAIGRESFTSYSIKYFCEIVKSLTDRRKNIVVNDSKSISISKDSIHYVIGLPNSGCVPIPDSEAGADFLLKMFGLPKLPHITFFGNKLKSREVLTDKEVFVCFMVIAFKCFLFPSSSELPNTDYLSILQDPESTSSVDLCKLVFEHFISGVHSYNRTCKLIGRKGKCFEFSNYILAVYYLDSLDFGPIILDQAVPRVSVWNGSLIKFFSDLDHVKNNVFGKSSLRNNLPSCYLQGALQDSSKCVKDASSFSLEPACFSLVFTNNLYLRFGSTIERKIIDGIIASVQTAITVRNPNVSKAEQCVTNVLDFLNISRCSENEIPKCAASLDGDMKISSEANV